VSSDITAGTNRFISTGSTPITYDAAGNITKDKKFRVDPQGDGMNYTYDANGRQITAAGTDEIGTQTSVYDCAGNRVQTSGNNVTRQMVYDVFGQLVADYKAGSLERENIYRRGQLLAVYEAASTCYKTLDQFIRDFYQGALGRQPNSTELATWTTILTQAQARGIRPLIGAAQDLGNTLFTSTEYPTNNSATEFVTDLYEAFLQRTPDSAGLTHWVGEVSAVGRSNVRSAFAVSPEFAENVTALCPGTSTTTSTAANLKYVLTDVQGSARALMNNNGSGTSTVISRHDYLPFGEEIWAGVGLRSTTQKYATTNNVRYRFALTERDEATGLDHTWFRKYDSFAGRWTSVDPYRGSMNIRAPQSFNRYRYVRNDPLNFVDPLGLEDCGPGDICYIFPPSDTGSGTGSGGNPLGGSASDTGIVIANGPEVDPGGGSGGGQGSQPQGQQQGRRRGDCYDFANEVAQMVKDIFENNRDPNTNSYPHNINFFMDRLARTYTEIPSATIVGLARAREHAREHGFNASTDFGTDGFKAEFFDGSHGSDNQVRHAVFGLVMGYSGIPNPLEKANDREDANTASGRADIALNNVTVPMGQRITGGVPGYSGELSARGLPDWIRQNLCAPR
jgi:RHS repeat-associated protein